MLIAANSGCLVGSASSLVLKEYEDGVRARKYLGPLLKIVSGSAKNVWRLC